jgi:phage terminase large subunit
MRVPDEAKFIGIGLDWGFTNDPTSSVRVYQHDQTLYVKEELHEKGLTNPEVSKRLNGFATKNDEIYADSSEPKSIEEVHRFGWNIRGAVKGPDSIINSIDILRRFQLVLIGHNLTKEFRTYKWKTDKAGKQLNEPVDFNNHLIDALRYLALMKLNNRPRGKYATMNV